LDAAVRQAQMVGKEKSQFAEVEPVVAKFSAASTQNPVLIPLIEKKHLMDEYNDVIWRTPKIQTSVVHYGDSQRKVIFLKFCR